MPEQLENIQNKLQTEIARLNFIVEFNRQNYQKKLNEWCYKYTYNEIFKENKDQLIDISIYDEDVEADIIIDNSIKSLFINLYNNKKHWLFTILNLSPKEICLLLIKEDSFKQIV